MAMLVYRRVTTVGKFPKHRPTLSQAPTRPVEKSFDMEEDDEDLSLKDVDVEKCCLSCFSTFEGIVLNAK